MKVQTPVLDYLDLAWHRKWLLAIPPILGLAAAAAVLPVLPKSYMATATIAEEHSDSTPVEPKRERVNYESAKAAQVRLQMLDFTVPATRLVLGLPKDAAPKPSDLFRVKNTLMQPEPLGDMIKFRASAPDPVFAAKVAEAYAELFVDASIQKQRTRTREMTSFYDNQVATQRAELDAVTRKIAAYRASHRGFMPEEATASKSELLLIRSELSRLEPELQARRQERESLAELLKKGPDMPAYTPREDDPAIKLKTLRMELSELRSRLTEKHPDVQAKLHDIHILEAQIALAQQAEAANPPAPGAAIDPSNLSPNKTAGFTYEKLVAADREIQTLEGRIESDRREIARREGALSEADRLSSEYQSLTRERDQLDAAYRTLSENREKSVLNQNLTEDATASLYRIIEHALPPDKPTSPIPAIILAIGLGLGLASGFGLVVLLEKIDHTYKSVDELKRDLQVPILATITRIQGVQRLGKRERFLRRTG